MATGSQLRNWHRNSGQATAIQRFLIINRLPATNLPSLALSCFVAKGCNKEPSRPYKRLVTMSSLMIREPLNQELWWIRIDGRPLSIGEFRIDSEGSGYFLIVGDCNQVYDAAEVVVLGRFGAQSSAKRVGSAVTAGLKKAQRKHVPCGSRVLSFRGWTKLQCGKCLSCRVRRYGQLPPD